MPVCLAKEGTAFAVPAVHNPISRANSTPACLDIAKRPLSMMPLSLSAKDACVKARRFAKAAFDVDQGKHRIPVRAARASRHAGAAGRPDAARRRGYPHDSGNEGEPVRPGPHRGGQRTRETVRADQKRPRALVESDQDGGRETGMIRPYQRSSLMSS